MATYCCTSGQVSKMQPVHTVVYRMQQKSSAFVFLLGGGGGGGGGGEVSYTCSCMVFHSIIFYLQPLTLALTLSICVHIQSVQKVSSGSCSNAEST